MSKWRVIDGCPVPASIAPYVYVVLRTAGQPANSVYRGEDAKAILHAHGKSTQKEIHAAYPGISNPPGRSTHELRSDGVAWPEFPPGTRLAAWRIGVDSGQDTQRDRDAIERAARDHGWHAFHPYSRGVELHHWGFREQPRPRSLAQRARLIALRARLPRK